MLHFPGRVNCNLFIKTYEKGLFSQKVYEKVYPNGSFCCTYLWVAQITLKSKSAKLKVGPIVSSINTYNYDLSRFLADLLLPCVNKDYCAEDTFSFGQNIKNIRSKNKYMVSYEVTILFTNIPLDETLDIAVDTIFKNNPEIEITKSELKKLFLFSTSEHIFCLTIVTMIK